MISRPFVRLGGIASVVLVTASMSLAGAPARAGTPAVLRVGTYRGIPGQFSSIQAAVDAAQAGDWILVGPGDYHEQGSDDEDLSAGVLIRTPGIHLRGMNRNTVVVDGTKPGSPQCSPAKADQQLGPKEDGHAVGRNGVLVYEVSGVTVDNLTACNFLTTPHGYAGNEIWFNGGDGTGHIHMHGYSGSYLTATSSYTNGVNAPFGDYGIFVSNADGPGRIVHTYASNMGDAAYYVGACPDCNIVIDDAHGQYSALAYSGTNSGGHLVIENSEFDHNKTGITTDSENNDDYPSPQNGHCPGSQMGPRGTGSCEIWRGNYIHDNNNPNVPGNGTGLAGAAPIGTGIVIAGGQYDTILHNRIEHNGAWGILITDVPYQGEPPDGATCQGGIPTPGYQACYYQSFGNETAGNAFKNNGFYGNATNGDIGLIALPHDPGNCFHGNTNPKGLTSDPPMIQSGPWATCGQPNMGEDAVLTAEALCATQLVAPCPDGIPFSSYPRPNGPVKLHMPPPQPTMPDPCLDVPANPWCPSPPPVAPDEHGVAIAGVEIVLITGPRSRVLFA